MGVSVIDFGAPSVLQRFWIIFLWRQRVRCEYSRVEKDGGRGVCLKMHIDMHCSHWDI